MQFRQKGNTKISHVAAISIDSLYKYYRLPARKKCFIYWDDINFIDFPKKNVKKNWILQ